MHSLVTYLIIINVAALLLFTMDFFHYMRSGCDLIDHRALSFIGVAGGGLGMLAAFLVWDRRVVKDNVAWRFIAILSIIVWAFVAAWALGLLRPDWGSLEPSRAFRGACFVLVWMAVASTVTFIVFAVDKRRARMHGWRIREGALLGLSLAGGALGGIVAMRVLRHKTRVWYFRFGLPLMLIVQLAACAYLVVSGVL